MGIQFFLALSVLAAVTRSLFSVLTSIGLKRISGRETFLVSTDAVTVIVAAHNEQESLPALLACLEKQTYAKERIHVIIADDRSTPRLDEALLRTSFPSLHLSIVRIDDSCDNISPKKFALNEAISCAPTENLLLTDADCRPEPQWIEFMISFLHHNDVVLGIAPIEKRTDFVARYAHYESARTATFYCGAAGWKRPYMAVGRNWGFRKSLYEKSGGLEPLYHILGGDDDLLLQRFVKEGARVSACREIGSYCYSDAPVNFNHLLRQKLRHYSVSRYYTRRIKIVLGLVSLLDWMTILVLPVTASFAGIPVWIAVLFIFGKLMYDTKFILNFAPAGKRTRRAWIHRMIRTCSLPFLEIFHIVFSTVIGIVAISTKPRW